MKTIETVETWHCSYQEFCLLVEENDVLRAPWAVDPGHLEPVNNNEMKSHTEQN